MTIFLFAISPLVAIIMMAMGRSSRDKGPKKAKKANKLDLSMSKLSEMLINYKTIISLGQKNIDSMLKDFSTTLDEEKMKEDSIVVDAFAFGIT